MHSTSKTSESCFSEYPASGVSRCPIILYGRKLWLTASQWQSSLLLTLISSPVLLEKKVMLLIPLPPYPGVPYCQAK